MAPSEDRRKSGSSVRANPLIIDNVVVNQLFGVNTGLGMGILTFDWNQVIWIGSPLQVPWWAEVNIGIGFLLCYWFVVPILYYTNVRS